MPDRLGVITSCRAVMAHSQHVLIDDLVLNALAHEIAVSPDIPGWDSDLHYRDRGPNGDERTAMWLLVLDALNFCFWPQGEDRTVRWRVRSKTGLVDGYTALVAALTHAIDLGYPLYDASYLATISEDDVRIILAPADGHTEIPLFADRVNNLRELGTSLRTFGTSPATAFIRGANGSAISLVQQVVNTFPSFNDAATWQYADTGLPGNEVRFYKRAQILVGDLAGGLAGSDLVQFADLDQLTAFADYKVPQLLRHLGVLVYDPLLARMVDARRRIPAGDRMEMEIRAATIVACDRTVAKVRSLGRNITAAELDWYLWSGSQSPSDHMRPYHLTETIYY